MIKKKEKKKINPINNMKPRFSISDLLDPEKMKTFDKECERIGHQLYGKSLKEREKQLANKDDNSESLNNLGVEGKKLKEWGNEPKE